MKELKWKRNKKKKRGSSGGFTESQLSNRLFWDFSIPKWLVLGGGGPKKFLGPGRANS